MKKLFIVILFFVAFNFGCEEEKQKRDKKENYQQENSQQKDNSTERTIVCLANDTSVSYVLAGTSSERDDYSVIYKNTDGKPEAFSVPTSILVKK